MGGITIQDPNNPDLEVHSYSRLKLWRFCRQAHWFRYVDKIEPIMVSRPLKVGSCIHELIALKIQGIDINDHLKKLEEEYNQMFEEEKEYYGDLPNDMRRIISGYEKFHSKEDENLVFEHIEAELGPVQLTKYTSLTIRPDRVAEEITTGKKFLFETKTGKSIPSEDYRLWDMQTFLYIWGMRKLGHPIHGIIWDHVRSKAPTIPQLLKSGDLSKAKKTDTTYDTYLDEIMHQGLDPADYQEYLQTLRGRENRFFRRVKLPVKESMLKPIVEEAKVTSLEIHLMGKMKPVKNVSRTTCSMCSYKAICIAELLDLDVEFVKEREFRPRPKRETDEEEIDDNDSE